MCIHFNIFKFYRILSPLDKNEIFQLSLTHLIYVLKVYVSVGRSANAVNRNFCLCVCLCLWDHECQA